MPDDLPGNTEAIVWMQALAKETDFTHNSTDKGAVKPREAKIAAA